ncbi:glycosyltransferase [Gordonia polyisoprenivorans]|uniref:glycosyltransferase n=1 Tax=Gordonia polyisoprenivorans TaxID=84595 RepID=UPI0022FFFFDB|nr:glycosyltransferase [Gordonia polyisoprenivorans]WCB38570.1 glycosyltransferase [Gordonia polyisoprenivorans]
MVTDDAPRPRIAIAHDYLTQRGGAEKVVLSLSRAFPDAVIHTLLFEPDQTYPEFADKTVVTSPVNRIGFLRKNHRAALPLLPFAASRMVIDADIVLTSTSGWAHGFSTTGTKIVYCYSPARWLYQTDVYLGETPSTLKRFAMSAMGPGLKRWDRRAAYSCDRYLAISNAVRDRIRTTYGLSSTVVSAPVTAPAPVEGAVSPDASLTDAPFFLCISRLLSYKNVDKVIEAFRGSGRRLVVVGRGPEKDALQAICPDNVTMLQDLTDAEMAWLYQHCVAVVAASYEDYGLTPLEGGMYGKPCVVLRWGGFLDTVVEGINGEFFDEPEPEQIRDAVDRVVAMDWDTDVIRHHVHKFDESAFISEIRRVIDESTPGPKPAEPGATELRPTDLGPAASAKEMV